MHKLIKLFISVTAVAALLLSFSVSAAAAEPAEQGVKFAAHCSTEAGIAEAIAAKADYISIGGKLTLKQAAALVNGKAALIVDAQSIEEADEKFAEIQALNFSGNVYYRIKAGAGKAVKWAESKGSNVKLIGLYTGNIYFSALSHISKLGKYQAGTLAQLQTGNQDGVILHSTVTNCFAKKNAVGMFSFINTEKSAKRTDSTRSWDDLIASGYTVIETAYPADFAQYLAENTAEREKLQASITAAQAADLESGFPNRINTYNKLLSKAETLLLDSSCATYEMADMRAELNEAVKNLNIDDGKKVKGDFEITPGRIAAALFGIALVLSWQIFFRKRWAKTDK